MTHNVEFCISYMLQLSIKVACCSHAGAFGKVFEGMFNDPDKNRVDVTVAIKTIKSIYTYVNNFISTGYSITEDYHVTKSCMYAYIYIYIYI